MINAKNELLSAILGHEILCAEIWLEKDCNQPGAKILLNSAYTNVEMEEFLNKLNFSYDNGYGSQELFGTVWLNKDSWLEREEYDGAECWEIRKLPKIPQYLKRKPYLKNEQV